MPQLTLSPYVQLDRARKLADALTWTEDGDGTPCPAGDVGGDVQLDGAALSRAWWAELPNGLHARIQIAFFIGEAPERRHSDLPADEDKSLHMQVEYLICSDRNDPGGIEANAEYTHDPDVAPELRATDANVLDLVTRPNADTVGWGIDEERVLDVLTLGLPPVSKSNRQVTTSSTTRWLFIGDVPIGSITEVDTVDRDTVYLALAHDWDNENPTPLSTPSGKPDENYDPLFAQQLCTEYAEAVRVIVERVPPRLSRHVYEAADQEVQTT